MWPIIGGLIGLLLGQFVFGPRAFLAGPLFGVLIGLVIELRGRLARLEQSALRAPARAVDGIDSHPGRAPTPAAHPDAVPASRPAAAAPATAASIAPPEPQFNDSWDRPAAPGAPDFLDRLGDRVREFFTSGNLVVKIGVIVLFFGVAFLLRYAVEHNKFPIELRFIAAAVGAIVMLVVGWRLRLRRAGYALIIQGAAVGVLYLTVFAAARQFDLVPIGFAFGVMIALTVLSGVLAVLQNARALAAFGAAGGFLAPVLLSTGGGNHIVLFSFYALLNAGILGIAWFKAWRELNLLGFVFTFVVGATWGARSYRPELFASTEPFLILFFLFFVAIAVLFAHRQPPQLKGYVDGSLVFGVPIVGFGMQAGLVHRMDYGLAISALLLSAFYLSLASALWRRQVDGMRTLTEAFLALGVVFGSLAIPLALDGNWTAAAWALEGAALVWLGVRQQRATARAFGVLLQLGAGVAFLAAGSGKLYYAHWLGTLMLNIGLPHATPVWNALYLGSALIGIAGLASNYFLERGRHRLHAYETLFAPFMLAWGLTWWLAGGLHEIFHHLSDHRAWPAAVTFVAASAWLMGAMVQRLTWIGLGRVLLGLLPFIVLLALGGLAFGAAHLFAGWGALAWAIAFAAHFWLLRRHEDDWPQALVRVWHAGGLVLLTFILADESAWAVTHLAQATRSWQLAAWGAVPAFTVLLLVRLGPALAWPTAAHEPAYLLGGGALLAFLGLWSLTVTGDSGAPLPLPYIPVLSPLDIVQLLALIAALRFWQRGRAVQAGPLSETAARVLLGATGVVGFVWLTAAVARSVHAISGVAYQWPALAGSVVFQAALTITWSLVALIAMVTANARGWRILWFAGGALLAIVVAKLFLVDLTGIGTVARIVSFLGVGMLMLIIGYFSPLPPRQVDAGQGG